MSRQQKTSPVTEIDLGITEGISSPAIDDPILTPDIQQDVSTAKSPLLEVTPVPANAQTLAEQFAYNGLITVGTLEDEIRYYQYRTVEGFLEIGKRLLLLKEITPHGEFEQRVETLGFATRTAHRFMSAAQKIFKTAKLADLKNKVKNITALLEVITYDDDVIENLSKMDDLDRMTASELRRAARELQAEKGKLNEKLNAANERREEVERRAEKKSRFTEFSEETEAVRRESLIAEAGAEIAISALKTYFDECVEFTTDDREQRLQLEQVWLTAHAVTARAVDLMRHMHAALDTWDIHDMPERVMGEHVLTNDEAEWWQSEYRRLLNAAAVAKADRLTREATEKPRKAGRPKGAKNKKPGAE